MAGGAVAGASPKDRADVVPQFTLGTRHVDDAGNVYQYVKASGAVARYAAIRIPGDYQCAAITNSNDNVGLAVGVPQVALADDQYAWALIAGRGDCMLASGLTADASLGASSTAGRLGASSTSALIDGITSVGATSANGAAPVAMSFPVVADSS